MSTTRIQQELAAQSTAASSQSPQENTPLIQHHSPYTNLPDNAANNVTYCGYPESQVIPIACAASCTCLVCLTGLTFGYLSGSVLTSNCMTNNFQTLCSTCPDPVTSIFNPCDPRYPARDAVFGCIWTVFTIVTGYAAKDTWKTVLGYYSALYETDGDTDANNAYSQVNPQTYTMVGA